jgi:shikimate dehydrogenase
MTSFGLIGYPVAHSSSVAYFTSKFRQEGLHDFNYHLFPLQDISGLSGLIADNSSLCGLNVTIPHKITVMAMLHKLDVTAAAVGAVNTIAIIRNNNNLLLEGYNTDVTGFEQSLLPLLKPWHERALVLGTGGASRAVAYVLRKNHIPFILRNPREHHQCAYSAITGDMVSAHKIIINTTPLGKYPLTSTFPDLPYELLTAEHLLYDLNYNPVMTRFLESGAAQGATVKSGLQMLHLQADASWEIWKKYVLPVLK